MLAQVVRHDQEEVQVAALRAAFDVILAHSPAPFFSAQPQSGDVTTKGAPLPPVEDSRASELFELLDPILQQPDGALRRRVHLTALPSALRA